MTELLEVRDLKIEAPQKDGSAIPIVKGVSFDVKAGEVVALIGESGSGKTTISLGSLGYTKPGLEFSGGEIRLHGLTWKMLLGKEQFLFRSFPGFPFCNASLQGAKLTWFILVRILFKPIRIQRK